MPVESIPKSCAITKVVPEPQNGSNNLMLLSLIYFTIIFNNSYCISETIVAGYFPILCIPVLIFPLKSQYPSGYLFNSPIISFIISSYFHLQFIDIIVVGIPIIWISNFKLDSTLVEAL